MLPFKSDILMVKVDADINLNVPGLHFVLPCTEKLTAIDLRTQVFDVVPQEVNHLLYLVGSEVVVLAMTLAGGADIPGTLGLQLSLMKLNLQFLISKLNC